MARILYPATLLLMCACTIGADSQERSADDTFRTGERLYSLRRYGEAEPHFARIAAIREPSPRGERSLYYLAECQYQQEKYIAAFESLERLHAAFPGTELREQLVKARVRNGRILAGMREVSVRGNGVPEAEARSDSPRTPADFRQLALRAFHAALNNDPTGVMAEYAAMHLAGHYLSAHDYDAAEISTQIVYNYPRSPLRGYRPIGRLEASIRGFVTAHWVLVSSLLTLCFVIPGVFVRARWRRVVA